MNAGMPHDDLFFLSVARRDYANVVRLMHTGMNVNATCKDRTTALMLADTKKMVKLLLAYRADPNQIDVEGRTALHHAILQERQEIVDLLTPITNLHAKDINLRTPLFTAVQGGYYEGVRSIVNAGYPLETGQDLIGQTILHVAVPHPRIVRLLLQRYPEIDVNAATHMHITPLMMAAWGNPCRLETMRLLLGHKDVDVNARDLTGRTAIMMAYEPTAVSMLMKAGADPRLVSVAGHTALQNAIQYNFTKLEIILQYIKKGDVMMPSGESALIFAAKQSSIRALHLLLAYGANTRWKDAQGQTALHCCLTPEAIQLLIQYRANPNAKNSRGSTSLLERVLSRQPDMIETLLNNGADINIADGKGMTPLMHACKMLTYEQEFGGGMAAIQKPMEPTFDMLLGHPPVQLDLTDYWGRTALHHAASIGNLYHVRQLLRKGADDEIRNDKALTALDEAYDGMTWIELKDAEDLARGAALRTIAGLNKREFWKRKGRFPGSRESVVSFTTTMLDSALVYELSLLISCP